MAFEELKAKQSVMWGTGSYEPIVGLTEELHERLVEHLDPQPGERFLDVATGTGAVALRAARAGADVTGVDLAPALVETARRRAGHEGLSADFKVGDAENLPFEDGSFDVVASAIGVMFAPDHAAVARELARVCRPGGRLGLVNWTPESGTAEMFKVMAPFQPTPPAGIGIPFDWGRRSTSTPCSGATSTSSSRSSTHASKLNRASSFGRSSRPITGRRGRSRSRSSRVAARSCIEFSSTSTSATGSTAASTSRATFCSCWAGAARPARRRTVSACRRKR